MRIILVGFMGVGKSTIGKCLAEQLNFNFVDLDEAISKEAGMSIKQIFKIHGEQYFRKIEKAMLKKVASQDKTVISTGGGAICNESSIKAIQSKAIIVHLKRYEQDLVDALYKHRSSRPLIMNKTKSELILYVRKLYKKRRYFYNQANFVVYNNNRPDKVASRIVKKILN